MTDTVGKRISQARRELGVREHRDIKPADLAEMVGVSETTVYRWEGDEKEPSDENLGKLAECLGVSRAWLKFEEGPKTHAETIPALQPQEQPPTNTDRKGKAS